MAGFTRSESRRMDAEMCIVNMCQPELDADMESLLARLTRIEDQIRSGAFTVSAQPASAAGSEEPTPEPKEEPVRVEVAPEAASRIQDEAPVGFWTDVAQAVKKELTPSVSGFFATTPNAPVKGVLSGEKLYLVCANQFVMDIINKPDVMELVARKASAQAGKPLRVVITDESYSTEKTGQLQQLLDFGRAHSSIINIKNS
jgi:DNA polymerase-3 subunit gamma/tau